MSDKIQNITVLGGRGNLGQQLVPLLLSEGFEVTVLTRSTSKAHIPNKDSGVSFVSSDYSLQSLIDAFRGQDAIVATISTDNVAAQQTIVDAAVAAGVKRILPSEFGSDTSREDLESMAPFLKSKKDVIDYIKTKESSGLSWTALCTGAWYDWYGADRMQMLQEGDGLVGWDVKAKKGIIYGSGDQRFTVTNFSTVSRAIVAVLNHMEETRNQYVFVSSFDLTQNMVWAALERVTGCSFDIERSDTSTLHATAMQHLKEGEWSKGYYELVTATVYSGTDIVYFPEKANRWNKTLGLAKEETLDQMIKRVMVEMSILDA